MSKVEIEQDKRMALLLARVLKAEQDLEPGDRSLLAQEIGWMATQQSITPAVLATLSDAEVVQFFEGMVAVATASRGVEDLSLDVGAFKTPAGKRWGAIASKVARAFDR